LVKGHATAVLLVTPQGIPVVRDLKKPTPIFWKLPGGRSKESAAETAKGCAIRELTEEIGVSLSENDLTIIYSLDKGNHTLTIFRADLTVLPQIKSQGDDGEEIRVFAPKDLLAEQSFFLNHRKVVEEILATLL
jgi:ADP-ribose pyrophosphatase YjhB (NUDIX family)